jgi:hypothetical protein
MNIIDKNVTVDFNDFMDSDLMKDVSIFIYFNPSGNNFIATLDSKKFYNYRVSWDGHDWEDSFDGSGYFKETAIAKLKNNMSGQTYYLYSEKIKTVEDRKFLGIKFGKKTIIKNGPAHQFPIFRP